MSEYNEFGRGQEAASPSSGEGAVATSNAREKWCYIGAPAVFLLELFCRQINEAFGGFGCYGVGSAWERPDWRDVDVRFIMEDDEFNALFPDVKWKAGDAGRWEFDPRWLIMTSAISAQLSKQTGLPIDFQFQPQSHANDRHSGNRHPLGLHFTRPGGDQ